MVPTEQVDSSSEESLNIGQSSEQTNRGFGGHSGNLTGPTYVAGPLDGSLYAQVDKNLKKQIRSYSLDSGIHNRGTRDAQDLLGKQTSLHSYKTGPLMPQGTATLNRYQFSRNSNKILSDGDITMEADLGGNIHSIDKLLKELGECSELLDNTIQQGRKASERTTPGITFQELSSAPLGPGKTPSKSVSPPTPLRRAASYGATERYLEERHGVPAKMARINGIGSPFPTPTSTSTPKPKGLHAAPTLQTHSTSLSPKFYASKVVIPYKTTVGQSCEPGDAVDGPRTNPKSQAYLIGDSVDVKFGANGYYDNDIVMQNNINGKGGVGDINNNAPDSAQNGVFENDEDRNEEDEFPKKGNVAAKVAFLTEIVFPAQPPEQRNSPLKGTVPMPGLVGKSPTDISDEISKYNAQSLAVGELSHCGNTLYRGGAPQRIADVHPGPKDRSDSTVNAELAEKLKAARDKSEASESAGDQTKPLTTESYDDGIETRSERPVTTNSPPVFVNSDPREFTIGQPIVFSIPTESRAVEGGKPGHRVDEDGYAELDDIQTTHHVAKIQASKPSPIIISKDIHTQPSMVAVLSSEPIDGILSEMADINLSMPEEDTSSNAERPPTPQTPSSSVSGPFDNSPRKKRSPFHSDKGYGSTNSLSSDSSSNDVFLDSPAIVGLKFDKDTSQFWYKPNISRDQAITLLKDKEPGYFVVRDSQSFPGAYGLAVRVAVPPAHVLQGDLTKIDLASELIRHFLIESTKKGVKLRGISNEPVFGSLSALIFQHTITPLSLPIRLVIPAEDLMPETDKQDGIPSPKSPKNDTMQLMFVGECGVEMLSGISAIQKTVESLLAYSADPKFTSTSFKITKQGITVTDNERKVFFRKHFPMNSVLYCGIDPLDQRWDLKIPSYKEKSRTFGLVVRKMGEMGNDCHLFAEMDSNYPINTVVNLVNKFMMA